MKWLLRPVTLVVLSLGLVSLVVLAGVTIFWVFFMEQDEDDREMAWLDAATSAASWERFVTGVHTAAQRMQAAVPGLDVQVDDSKAFPPHTTAIPEIVVWVPGTRGKLRFRWYKLTSERNTGYWIKALVKKKRPPLAIIGGSSSDQARELAERLEEQRQQGGAAPLLLLTTATANEIETANGSLVELNSIYPGHTYRFCFTNRFIARVVTDFIWHRDDQLPGQTPQAMPTVENQAAAVLRPDTDRVYRTFWEDDPYSVDLATALSGGVAASGTCVP